MIFTLEELKDMLTGAAGVPEGLDLQQDIADLAFEELGYDSLALLEVGGRIERRFGVDLGDWVSVDPQTPRTLLDLVNELAAERPAA